MDFVINESIEKLCVFLVFLVLVSLPVSAAEKLTLELFGVCKIKSVLRSLQEIL